MTFGGGGGLTSDKRFRVVARSFREVDEAASDFKTGRILVIDSGDDEMCQAEYSEKEGGSFLDFIMLEIRRGEIVVWKKGRKEEGDEVWVAEIWVQRWV